MQKLEIALFERVAELRLTRPQIENAAFSFVLERCLPKNVFNLPVDTAHLLLRPRLYFVVKLLFDSQEERLSGHGHLLNCSPNTEFRH